jgi:hypothetical protein
MLSGINPSLPVGLAGTARSPHPCLMAKHALRAVLLLTSWGVAACTPAPESPPQGEISDSAGLRIAQNGTSSWAEERRWTVPPDPALVIGVRSGPEEYQFVEIADAARRSDGSVVVVDRGARSVRLYDAHGMVQAVLGGPGVGPGEFTDPVSVRITVGDTVVIWDQALLRATRFTPSGNVASVQTVEWGRMVSRLGLGTILEEGKPGTKGSGVVSGLFPGAMEPTADGGFLVRLVEKTGGMPPSGSHRRQSGVLRVSGDLSVVDTLTFFGDTEQVGVDAPWGRFSVTPPGAKQTQIAQGGDPPRTCVGDQEEAEILCFTSDGRQSALRWEPVPVALTEDDLGRWREETVRLLDPKLSRDQVLEMLDQVPVPEFRPPYSRILLDPAGDLWAERGPTRGRSGHATDFLVFDPDGLLLGVVVLPPIRVLEIGLDYVLGIYRDELEIQYLWIHELRKPSG